MPRIDLKNKAIQAKLVYYGPGLCGKTTNLQYINAQLANGQELMSLATEGDRTIFFDFMPLDLGKLRGLDVKFKLYTVPGQVRYNQTRKMVLKNVDGVVFVADSQTEMIDANRESLDNLFENLQELGISPDGVPVVLQYNKRDLPNVMATGALDAELNVKGFPTFTASAATGDGVVETLKAACKEVLAHLSKALPGEAPARSTAVSPLRSKAAANTTSEASARGAGELRPTTGKQAAEKPPALDRTREPQAPSRDMFNARQEPTAAPSPLEHEALAELSRSLAAARQELTELRGPARLDESSLEMLAARLVSKADMVVMHRRVDGVEEVARGTGARVEQLVQQVGDASKQLEQLGGLGAALAQQLAKPPAPAIELPVQLEQLPTKTDLASLAKRLEQLEQLPTKTDLASLAKRLEQLERLPAKADPAGLANGLEQLPTKTDLASLAKRLEQLERLPTKTDLASLAKRLEQLEQLPTKTDLASLAKRLEQLEQLPTKTDLASLAKRLERLESRAVPTDGSKADPRVIAEATAGAVRDLAGKRDLEAVSARLGELGKQLSTWQASLSDLTTSRNVLESTPRREDLAEVRAAVAELSAQFKGLRESSAAAPPPTDLGKLVARLEHLPTKAELAAVAERLATLPTRADLERLDQRVTEALAQAHTLAASDAANASQGPVARRAEQLTADSTAQPEPSADASPPGQDENAPPPSEQSVPPEARADDGSPRAQADNASTQTQADDASPQSQADDASPQTQADDASPQSQADDASPQSQADDASPQTQADDASPQAQADDASTQAQPDGSSPLQAVRSAQGEATADQPVAETAPQPAGASAEPGAAAAGIEDDSPQDKNAQRVARVMVADLYLYNKEQVEAGIRENDFFERNHEALEDMRLTFESRVSAEVRAKKDYLRLAIEAFIEKKRAKLVAP